MLNYIRVVVFSLKNTNTLARPSVYIDNRPAISGHPLEELPQRRLPWAAYGVRYLYSTIAGGTTRPKSREVSWPTGRRYACDAVVLQKDLEQMCSWAKNWHMRFNASKCTVLTITKKKTPIKSTYTIGGQALEQVDHHPYLGVELSKNLSWDHQINQTVSKAQKTLNLIRRNITECS